MNDCTTFHSYAVALHTCLPWSPGHWVCSRHVGRRVCCGCERLKNQREPYYAAWKKSYYAQIKLPECSGNALVVSRRPIGYFCDFDSQAHYVCVSHHRLDRRLCCRCLHREHHGWDSESVDRDQEESSPPCMQGCVLQGNVASTRSGNTDTSVVAREGSRVRIMNYFGTNYANASSNAAQAIDPTKLAQPMMDAAGVLTGNVLKNPTAEEIGYSDRLMQITNANTVITTQEAAAGAVIAWSRYPTYSEYTESGQDLQTRPGPSCDRFFTLGSWKWTADTSVESAAALGHFSFPGQLINTGVMGQNMQFHFTYRSGVCFHVQANATRFYGGCLLVVVIPEAVSTDVNIPCEYDRFQLPLFPHQYINLRTNNSATIVVPYVSSNPVDNVYSHNWCRLYVIPLTPLRYPAGSNTFVQVTVTCAPLCSEFSGLRYSVNTQGLPTFQVPGSGQFLTTAAYESQPAYPQKIPVGGYTLPGRIEDIRQIAVLPTFCNPDGNTVFFQVQGASQSAGQLLWELELDLANTKINKTALARVLQMYCTWRGSIKIMLTFVAPALTTCKMLLAYAPPGNQQHLTYNNALLCTNAIWDTGLQSTFTFTIPYIALSQFRYTRGGTSNLTFMGVFAVFLQTSLSYPPNGPTTADVIVSIAAGDDLILRTPIDSPYYQGIEEGDVPALTAAEAGAVKETNVSDVFATRDLVINFDADDSTLETLMSRFAFMTKATFSNNVAEVKLNFNDWRRFGAPLFKAKFGMATYWKFDLDIVAYVGAPKEAGRCQMVYIPPYTRPEGTLTESSPVWLVNHNPSIIFHNSGVPISMRIPYPIATHYVASYYDGYPNDGYGDRGNYAECPANWFGSLAFRLLNNVTTGSYTVSVFIKLSNVEAYVPRPIKLHNNSDHTDMPLLEPQGFTFISELVKQVASTAGDGFAESFARNVNISPQALKIDWVATAIQWMVKFVSGVVVIVRSAADPIVVAAVSMGLGVDILMMEPMEYIKKLIPGLKRTQGPMDVVRNLNSALQLGKGFEWLVSVLQKLIDLVRDHFTGEKNVREQNLKMLRDFLDNTAEWDRFKLRPNDFREDTVRQLAEEILSFRDVYSPMETSPQLVYLTNKYFLEASKYLSSHNPRAMEPIGLLIHGEPGTGKSLATTLIGKALSRYFGVCDPYVLPPDPKYFDGYTGQKVVIMDDLGQNPDGQDCAYLCQMISTTDFHPPMADVGDKGVSFTSEFVLASTNLQQLAPPTISSLQAIARRFVFDCEIVLDPQYTENGKLAVARALTPCNHPSNFYSVCCPFVCGLAVKFKDKHSGAMYSLDALVGLVLKAHEEKTRASGLLSALLQGPLRRKVSLRPAPQVVIDLLRATRNEEVMVWCVENGLIVPDDVVREVERERCSSISRNIKMMCLGFVGLLSVMSALMLAYRFVSTPSQGPYEGVAVRKPVPKPRRQIEVQGSPDMEFAISIMKSNLVPIQTDCGTYTAFGLYSRCMILPTHALGGDIVVPGFGKLLITECYDLFSKGAGLEMSVVHFSNWREFRDVRSFICSTIEPHRNALLVINSPTFPSVIVPVGHVTPYGMGNVGGVIIKNLVTYAYPTISGYCGGLVVKAGKIIAMHVAGDGVNGYGAALKSTYFMKEQGEIVLRETAPSRVHVNRKTAYQPSVWSEFRKPDLQPAVLSDYDPRAQASVTQVALSKYKGEVLKACPRVMEVAAEYYAEMIRPLMPLDVAEPLTREQAVFGYGVMEGLNLSTSAGYPFVVMGVRKRDLIDSGERDISRLVEALDVVQPGQPFVTYFKDELRPAAKIKEAKTRVIEASSLVDVVRTRQVLGRFFEAMLRSPGVATGSAIGCDPDTHWTQFYTMMHANVTALDYKNYDASLPSVVIDLLRPFFRRFGIDVHDIVRHINRSPHILENEMYWVVGGMPSGTAGTSMFNTILNNILIRGFFLMAYDSVDLNDIRVLAYGDDVLVSAEFDFDPEVLAQAASLCGMQITPARKDGGYQRGWDQVTFLKRGFKPDGQYPYLIHPIYDVNLAMDSLCWTKNPSATVEHVTSLLHLVWHSGEEVYAEFVEFVRKPAIGQALPILPYSYLRHLWLSKFGL